MGTVARKLKRDDKRISIAIVSPFVVLTFQYFVLMLFSLSETKIGFILQLASKALVGLAFVYALAPVLKRSKSKLVVIYLLAILIFIVNLATFADIKPYAMDLAIKIFFMSLPALVYSLSIKQLDVFHEITQKASYIVLLFGILIYSFLLIGKISIGAYSMSLSYYMLLPCIIYLNKLLDGYSVKHLAFAALSILVIISIGARGPVLCIVIFAALKLLRSGTDKAINQMVKVLSILGIGIISFINFHKIIEYIYNKTLSYGIKSRTLWLLLCGEIATSQSREKLFRDIFDALLESPLIGYGIGGDRVISGSSGLYAHNIFLEMLTNYGVVIGSIALITLGIIFIRNLFNRDLQKYNIFIIWFSMGFMPLMVSGSYLTNINFWILLGLSLNMVKQYMGNKVCRKYTKRGVSLLPSNHLPYIKSKLPDAITKEQF